MLHSFFKLKKLVVIWLLVISQLAVG